MDNIKNILLGNKDILSRSIKDLYIDINLSKNNKEIISQKFDNTFDLTKFYNQERNESRNFVVYGKLDSYSIDCNNLQIDVYQSPYLNPDSFLCTTYSSDVVNGNMPFSNIYNKLKGRYIIDNIPTSFTGYSIYLKINSPVMSFNYVTEQQLIFTTLTLSNTGIKTVERLGYGINESVTDCDGNIIEINNDFDFFYNKHWVLKDIFIADTSTKWVGDPNDAICLKDDCGYNTGVAHYNSIIQVYTVNQQPTGNVGSNEIDDMGNYIVPDEINTFACSSGAPNMELAIKIDPPLAGNIVLTPVSTNATSALFYSCQTVNMIASPSSCYNFDSFYETETGTILSQDLTYDVLMNSQRNITANFVVKKYVLKINIVANYTNIGANTTHTYHELPPNIISFILNGISCFTTETLTFDCGTPINITNVLAAFSSNYYNGNSGAPSVFDSGGFMILKDSSGNSTSFDSISASPVSYHFIMNENKTLEIIYNSNGYV